MSVINDKLEISSLMEGQFPPHTWNPQGTPLFTEKMQLNLTKIRISRYVDFQPSSKDYKWINIPTYAN